MLPIMNFKFIINHWKDFTKFLVKPQIYLLSKEANWNYNLLFYTTISSIMLMILGSIMTFILVGFVVPDKEIYQQKDVFLLPTWILIVVGGLLAPLFEELSFRLPLKLSFKNSILALLFSIFLFSFLSKYHLVYFFQHHSFDFSFKNFHIPIVIFSVLMLGLFFKRANYFPVLMFVMAYIFAVAHQYENINSFRGLLYVSVASITQFLAGLYYSFIRMRFGLLPAILVHCIWNLLMISMSLIFGE